MAGLGNPYEPPTSAQMPVDVGTWRDAVHVSGAWLLAASLVGGVVSALHIGLGLESSSSELRTAPVAAINALRVYAPYVATIAAALGSFEAHQRPHATAAHVHHAVASFVGVPLAAVAATTLMTAVGFGVAASIFDVALAASWNGLGKLFVPSDLFVCIGKAALFATALSAAMVAVTPRVAKLRHRRVTKLIVVASIAHAVTFVVGGVFDSVYTEGKPLRISQTR